MSLSKSSLSRSASVIGVGRGAHEDCLFSIGRFDTRARRMLLRPRRERATVTGSGPSSVVIPSSHQPQSRRRAVGGGGTYPSPQ